MSSPVIVEAIRALIDRRDLTRLEAAAAMEALMSGAATAVQVAAFLTALRMKGETVEELIGLAEVMRLKAVRVRTRGVEAALAGTDREMLIDTCGTGGDASGTFNVSTATAFVVAGAGLKVAKHGNRSVSSLCGSADVVETLGVNLDLTPAKVGQCIDQVGIGFLYAPLLHTAMKHVMPARREMGIRTVFNILGPLTNPAGANAQVIGVYSRTLVEPLARVLAELGTIRAFVVHGADGLDEISTTGESWTAEVREGLVRTSAVRPEDFGVPRAAIADLRGGDREAERRDHPADPGRGSRPAARHGRGQRGRRARGRGAGARLQGRGAAGRPLDRQRRGPRQAGGARPRLARAGPGEGVAVTDAAGPLGAAVALAVASGLSLYGTVFVAGLAIRLGWVQLGPAFASLGALSDPVVLSVAGVLFAVEFLADKVPIVDSVWDAIHTVIRPVGGALLASRALGELSPVAEVLMLLLLGGATLATHAAKATTRLAVNASPEPVSNVVVSLAENGLVALAVWLALTHPLLALGAGLVALALAVTLVVWLGRRALGVLARYRGRGSGRASGGRVGRA